MAVSVRREVEALITAIKDPSSQSPIGQAVAIANAAARLVSAVGGSLDSTNQVEDFKTIRAELNAAAVDALNDVSLPWGSEALVPIFATLLVSKLEKLSPDVDEIKTDYLIPFFTGFKEFGEAGLIYLET